MVAWRADEFTGKDWFSSITPLLTPPRPYQCCVKGIPHNNTYMYCQQKELSCLAFFLWRRTKLPVKGEPSRSCAVNRRLFVDWSSNCQRDEKWHWLLSCILSLVSRYMYGKRETEWWKDEEWWRRVVHDSVNSVSVCSHTASGQLLFLVVLLAILLDVPLHKSLLDSFGYSSG